MMFNSKFAHNKSIDLYIRLLLRAWHISKDTPRAQVSIQIARCAHGDIYTPNAIRFPTYHATSSSAESPAYSA